MNKACPVVVRRREGHLEILVFRHPIAGTQLVKGTIEPGESGRSASERELEEEAGIKLKAEHLLLEWQRHPDEPTWAIWLMEPGDHLPDHWDHYCKDDGGHLFQYFWHPLLKLPDSEWHSVFTDALAAVRQSLTMRLAHAQR
ncbi:NUDIX domain-containing protein [Marinimicrobium sp. C6131]|uniref:NUDIX domain-containing protein n=1 Tax=Marinimicrobium sp. C6131 TaxID=3022676 RepID=UPI0039FCC2BB